MTATLRLNGFAVRSSANGVKCLGRCRVIGPGELARTEPSCDQQGILDAYGVFGNDAVTLQSATLTSWGFATWASGRLRATAVQISGHCDGLVGNTARIIVRDSTITNNLGLGVACGGGMSIARSTVTGNFIDVSAARRPRLRATTCGTSGGGPGSPPDTWAVCTAP